MAEEELLVVGTRSISTKGGSLQVTLPSEAVQMMDLKVGEPVLILYNIKREQLIITKISKIETPGGLSFAISKEEIKKIFKKEKEG